MTLRISLAFAIVAAAATGYLAHNRPQPHQPDTLAASPRAAEAQLQAELPQLLPAGSSIWSIECDKAECRIETAHSNQREVFKLMDRLTGDTAPWTGIAYTRILQMRPDGSAIARTTLTRPSPDAPLAINP